MTDATSTRSAGRVHDPTDQLRLEALACAWDPVTVGVLERLSTSVEN